MAEDTGYAKIPTPASRFPVLTFIAGLLQVLGWLGAAIGVLLILLQLESFSSSRQNNALAVLFVLLPSIGIALGGLLVVAIGEAARVFVSMENNTYRLVAQLLPDHRGKLAEGE